MLGPCIYPTLWSPRCRGCEIFHDHIMLHNVAVSCKSMHIPVPCMGIWTYRRMDRYGMRLDTPLNNFYDTLPFTQMA